LSLPLISTFQAALLSSRFGLPSSRETAPVPSSNTVSTPNASQTIRSLDPSIVIPPIRFHLTLGAMALTLEETDEGVQVNSPIRTVDTALALLDSLKPRLDAILRAESDQGRETPLLVEFEALDILRPSKPKKKKSPNGKEGESPTAAPQEPPPVTAEQSSPPGNAGNHLESEVWADVLYLAPREIPALRQISDVVHQEFKNAGYITEKRPLKLHCTVLNTSKRRPYSARGHPFCYSDILRHEALNLLSASPSSVSLPQTQASASQKSFPKLFHPPPIPINLGLEAAVAVKGVELWVMGSRDKNGAYVSCGGVSFGSGDQ
ncbi:hypothetical protein H0H93_011009, partial [Arthromyces matolae]